MADARKTALAALDAVFCDEGYSNLVIDKAIKQDRLDLLDASFAAALFYGVIERKLTLDHIIEKASKRSINKIDGCLINILRLGAYQIYYMDKVPASAAVNEAVKQSKRTKKSFLSGFCNAVLREMTREGSALLPSDRDLAAFYSCDQSIVDLLIRDYGKETARLILESSFSVSDTVLRVNTLKTDSQKLITLFEKEGVEAEDIGGNAVVLKKSGSPQLLDSYKDGLFHVQSRVSQQCAETLCAKYGDRVLDCCAAPGGKSFTIAEIMQDHGELVSCDIHPHRVELIKKGAERLGIDCIVPTVADASSASFSGEFDKILCDVPCSGLGMMAQKPEIKYKKAGDFNDLSNLQYEILCNVSKYLAPAGRLVYSTCTLNKAENNGVIARFLGENNGFSLVSEKTYLPHIDNGEGFYVAVLERC